jgi:hypothetical protein
MRAASVRRQSAGPLLDMDNPGLVSMIKCLMLSAALLMFAPAALAQDEHVYLIKMFDCTHKPVERSQTGFRVQGLKGIITALHGVADCRRVTASKKGLLLDQPLSVKQIDKDRDVALLSSEQVDGAPGGGLSVAEDVVWETLRDVKVYGHPYGISNLDTTLILRNPPLKTLKDLLPAAPLSTLKERRSPNHLIKVLSLQGNLLPGHSGAPILDSRGRVVGVANGGLKEGEVGISWAIPFKDIEWEEAGGKLKELALLNPEVLFSFDALPAQQLDEANDETCEQLSKLLAEAKTGFISIVGEPSGESSFKSKILLPGASHGYLYPKQYAGFFLFRSDKAQNVAAQYYHWVSRVSKCFPNFEQKELDTGLTPKHLRSLFREKGNSPVIEVSYNLVLVPNSGYNDYALNLFIYTASFGWW